MVPLAMWRVCCLVWEGRSFVVVVVEEARSSLDKMTEVEVGLADDTAVAGRCCKVVEAVAEVDSSFDSEDIAVAVAIVESFAGFVGSGQEIELEYCVVSQSSPLSPSPGPKDS